MINKKSKQKMFIGGLVLAFFVFYLFIGNFLKSKNMTVSVKKQQKFPQKKEQVFLENENTLKSLEVNDLIEESKFKEIFQEDKNLPVRTNQWFSSLYFKKTSEAIFALPLAVKFTKEGLEISKPQISSSKKIVHGAFDKNIQIVFERKNDLEARVISSGDFSVLVGLFDNEKKLCSVTIVKGSPFVFLNINKNSQAKVISDNEIKKNKDYWRTSTRDKTELAFFFSDTNNVSLEEKQLKFSTEKEQTLMTIAVIPQGANFDEFEKVALNPIENTKNYFIKTNDNKIINVFELDTKNSGDTIWGVLPHQFNGLKNKKECLNGESIKTLRGNQKFCKGNIFYINSNQNINPIKRLSFDNITEENKQELTKLVKEDINNFKGFKASDTYFRGKEILRIAQLYDFSKQLNLVAESEKLHNMLVDEFNAWRLNTENKQKSSNGRYFVYDNNIKGIIGYQTSFGSEEFNDHHFHYGYFIHAAAILGEYDYEFIDKNKDFINLIIKDYLNINRNDKDFPFIRSFDFYEGHSWAAGTALFGDGNDQESSSEAVHAYYAGFLWGQVIDDKNLMETSKWLYNQEADTALTYWLLSNSYSPKFSNYEHSLFSMIWGGKAEFSTWFSDEPEAKLAIQLIPFTAGSSYLSKISPEIIQKHLNETSFPNHKLFFDQLLMYKAIQNKEEALSLFNEIENKDLDDGNSRSFLYAWIITR